MLEMGYPQQGAGYPQSGAGYPQSGAGYLQSGASQYAAEFYRWVIASAAVRSLAMLADSRPHVAGHKLGLLAQRQRQAAVLQQGWCVLSLRVRQRTSVGFAATLCHQHQAACFKDVVGAAWE
eukprot:CAMPEP_0172791216 /NCGR_PEP_ID=MMETSP1074-20121228/208360_1 /TAXON_ID=2916 /ORGANISM="Ceratium fusus, Strain PA161109" /LENGTH=121 /DNA_ID=CAMNT_0013628273 /DNA_START=364 /DNA_END=726 /DNA_ORIENTATION=+